MIETNRYIRKPFYVDAVQVTTENMAAIAEWCSGVVNSSVKPFIAVPVTMPLSERQTKAFIGDWVLYAGRSFKVYTDKAFVKSFEQTDEDAVLQSTDNPPENPEGEMRTLTKYRDAGTGEYVTAAFAHENPNTTVSEEVQVFVRPGREMVEVAPGISVDQSTRKDEVFPTEDLGGL